MRRPRLTATIAVAASASLLLAGCAESNRDAIALSGITDDRANDPVEPIGPGGEVTLEAGDLYFADLEGIALDGEVTFVIDNVGGIHNLVIDQAAGDQQLIDLPPETVTTGSLLLYGAAAGAQYEYYCSIPGHRAAGMEGIITVFLDEETAIANGGAAANDPNSDPMAAPADGMGDASADDEATEEPSDEPTEEAEPTDEPTELVAGEVTEETIEALDDSDDVAGALDERGEAKLYAVSFDTGSATLTAEAEAVVADLAAWLEANPDEAVRIEGNTDSQGDEADNQTLSQERADAVVAALVDLGIDGGRLTAVGNGETNLLVDPDDDDDVAQRINRRVEVFVAG